MTLVITNAEAQTARVALLDLGEERLPVKCAYRIAVLKRTVSPVLEAFEEVRKQLVDKYGKRDEAGALLKTVLEGGAERVEIADVDGFNAAFAELQKVSTTLDALPLDLSMFGDVIAIEPDTLFNLGPLLVESPSPTP